MAGKSASGATYVPAAASTTPRLYAPQPTHARADVARPGAARVESQSDSSALVLVATARVVAPQRGPMEEDMMTATSLSAVGVNGTTALDEVAAESSQHGGDSSIAKTSQNVDMDTFLRYGDVIMLNAYAEEGVEVAG